MTEPCVKCFAPSTHVLCEEHEAHPGEARTLVELCCACFSALVEEPCAAMPDDWQPTPAVVTPLAPPTLPALVVAHGFTWRPLAEVIVAATYTGYFAIQVSADGRMRVPGAVSYVEVPR